MSNLTSKIRALAHTTSDCNARIETWLLAHVVLLVPRTKFHIFGHSNELREGLDCIFGTALLTVTSLRQDNMISIMSGGLSLSSSSGVNNACAASIAGPCNGRVCCSESCDRSRLVNLVSSAEIMVICVHQESDVSYILLIQKNLHPKLILKRLCINV
jgi:hypothetical protein